MTKTIAVVEGTNLLAPGIMGWASCNYFFHHNFIAMYSCPVDIKIKWLHSGCRGIEYCD